MSRVRRLPLAIMLIASLIAAGCMGTPTPNPRPAAASAPSPTVVRTVGPAGATQPVATLAPVLPTTRPSSQATPTTSEPTPLAPPVPGASVSLNLGVPLGNTYVFPYGVALDRTRGLLYVLGYGDSDVGSGAVSVVDLTEQRVVSRMVLAKPVSADSIIELSPDGALLFIVAQPANSDPTLLVMQTGIDSGQAGAIVYARPNVWDIAFDATSATLFVLEGNTLRQIDTRAWQAGRATGVDMGARAHTGHRLVVNGHGQRVYVDKRNKVVEAYDARDLRKVDSFTLPADANLMLAHPDRDETYVLSGYIAGEPGEPPVRVSILRSGSPPVTWKAGDGDYIVTSICATAAAGKLLLVEAPRRSEIRQWRARTLDITSGQIERSVVYQSVPALSAFARVFPVYQNNLYHVGDSITPVSLDGGQHGARIDVGIVAASVAVDDETGRLYVLDSTHAIHVVDTATFTETARWPNVAPAASLSTPKPLAVGAGRLYVADADAGSTYVFDAATGEKIGSIAKAGQLTIDERRNRVYITKDGVYVADGATLQIIGAISETMRAKPERGSPGAIAADYDPDLDLVFVTMSGNMGSRSPDLYLRVFRGDNLAHVDLEAGGDQLGMMRGYAADPALKRVWLASLGSTFGLARNLTAFSLDGRVVAQLKGVGERLFVDPGLQRLYMPDWDGIVILDTATNQVIDYRPWTLSRATPMIYDRKLHRFYAASLSNIVAFDPNAPVTSAPPDRREALPATWVRGLHSDLKGGLIAVLPPSSEKNAPGIYRTAPGGWQSIVSGLPATLKADVVIAPDAPDTMFAYDTSGGVVSGLYRTTDAGQSWRFAGNGLTDLNIRDMAVSPSFGKDGVAVLTTASGTVFASRDRGQTWRPLADVTGRAVEAALTAAGEPRFLIIGNSDVGPVLSLTFTASGERIVQSALPEQIIASSLALAPAGGQSNLALLWRSAPPDGFMLSEDFGQSWRKIDIGSNIAQSSSVVAFSPGFRFDRTIYAVVKPSIPGYLDRSVLLRSLDGGLSWETAANADAQLMSIAVTSDGRLWGGSYTGEVKRILPDSLTWRPVAPPTAVAPTATRPPSVLPTPTVLAPPGGLYWPDNALRSVWQNQKVSGALGWATEPAALSVWAARQYFERGTMIWREDTRRIYVLSDDGKVSEYEDTWTEGQPDSDPNIVAPANLQQPRRGFGKLWRSNAAVREQMGWALTEELGYTAQAQTFQSGIIIVIDGACYIVKNANGPALWFHP